MYITKCCHIYSTETKLYHIVKIFVAYSRDVIKDDFGRKSLSGRPFRPDVRARPRLPRGCSFTHERVFTVRRCGKNRVRADAGVCPRERAKNKKKKKKKIFFFFG
jgi:hypothetical protein